MRAALELEDPTPRINKVKRISSPKRQANARSPGYGQYTAGTLYRYLDLEQLIEAFTIRLMNAVTFDSLKFKNTTLDQVIDRTFVPTDVLSDYVLEFDLGSGRGDLGHVTIRRRTQFLSVEIRRVRALIDSLTGPLGNATKYLIACQSAYHDALTGVKNRAALDMALSQSRMRQGAAISTALLVCDVDRFKSINDNCGHKTGDLVLQQFAKLLKLNCEQGDALFRYGGDEFVMILYGHSLASATEYAERLRQSIEQATLHIDNACINLTSTIGIAGVRAGESLDEVFLRADAALLSGKKSGKNKVVCR